jgi:hypothetical protein
MRFIDYSRENPTCCKGASDECGVEAMTSSGLEIFEILMDSD